MVCTSTRWVVAMRNVTLGLFVATLMAVGGRSALADVSGGIGQSGFSGFTINEGQSGTAVLQLTVSPADSSGGAGSTTNRINGGNPLTFSSPGAVSTPIGVNNTGGNVITATWNAGFQYNLPGVYNVSYGGTVSWQHTANPSYSTGTDNGTGFNNVGSNINVTVNNVAPVITSANLNGSNANTSVGQGASVTLNMTATDAGSQNTSFTINGGGAGVAGGTPGSTRTSSNTSFSAVGLAPGVYNQTFQATDASGANASNGPIVRSVTVTNVGPTITSANLNGTNGDITLGQGAAVSLNMTATDPGNDTMSFAINGGAAGSTGVQAGNSVRTSSTVGGAIGLAPGVYTQTFTATDQYGASAGPLTRNVTVTNVAPTITSANQNGINGSLTVLQGASVTLNLTATDPGNDTMSFTINGGGAGSTGVQAGGSTRTSADNSVQYFTPGVFTNTFQATDQYGADASNGPQTHDVTVVNVAPVITSLIASEIPNILGNGCLMFFTATSTDPGILDSAIYSWDLNGDNIFGDYVSNDPAPPWSSTTPTTLYGLGSHTIGVMVTDNWGGFDPVNGVAYLTFECLPEPSTWVAILLSGGALAFFHRRKKRKA